MAGVDRFYSGILQPGGGLYKGTGDAGVYDGILPGATGSASGELTTRSVKTVPIDPYTGQPAPARTTNGLTPQQIAALQAVRAVPAISYQWPKNTPVNAANSPAGFSFADTGNLGRASGPMTQKIAIAGYNSALPGMFGRGLPAIPAVPEVPTAYASVPLPRSRPASGMPGPTLGDLLAYVQSTESPGTPATAAAADLAGASPGTSLSSMFTPGAPAARPADAYAAANALGSVNAQQKRSTLSGVGTNGYTYENGVNKGYSDEEKAKRDALGKAIGDANRKSAQPTRNISGDNNAFMPASVQNSVRWQTGY